MFNKRLRGIFPTIMLALVASLLVTTTSPAQASDDFVAPEPTIYNPCGSNQDRIVVPGSFAHPQYGFSDYTIDGASVTGQTVWVTEPKTVTVVADRDSGLWTYVCTFTAEPCVEEAANVYRVSLGRCNDDPSSIDHGITSATAFVTNVVDETGRSIPEVRVSSERTDGWTPGYSEVANDIMDGETRTIPIVGVNGGFYPGAYTVRFHTDDPYVLLARRSLNVPACGDETPPPVVDEPVVKKAKPKAKVYNVDGKTKMRVKAINRKVDHRTVMRVKVNPGWGDGKTKVRFMRLGPNKVKTRAFFTKVGTRVVVARKLKVGPGEFKWKTLAKGRKVRRAS